MAQERLSAEAKDAVDERYYRLKTQYSQLDARPKGIDDQEIRSHGANRADVVALDPIYESEIERPDPIKKAKLKFRVVTI